MEVHHPHHPAHKKKWSEYILEFFMLFFAVTLGFFAENVREHQVLIERKNENLASIIQDLKMDSIQLEMRVAEYMNGLKALEDMKFASYELHKKKINEEDYITLIANKSDSLTAGISFFLNNSAYKNTISTGSLSVIDKPIVKKLIAEYYEELGAKLIDNNKNLDTDIGEYISKSLQMAYFFESEERKSVAHISHKELIDYIKTIPAYKKSITDPSFIIYTQRVEMRCEYYLGLMKRFQEVNKELIKALEYKD